MSFDPVSFIRVFLAIGEQVQNGGLHRLLRPGMSVSGAEISYSPRR